MFNEIPIVDLDELGIQWLNSVIFGKFNFN
jgi:hypothetical protein